MIRVGTVSCVLFGQKIDVVGSAMIYIKHDVVKVTILGLGVGKFREPRSSVVVESTHQIDSLSRTDLKSLCETPFALST